MGITYSQERETSKRGGRGEREKEGEEQNVPEGKKTERRKNSKNQYEHFFIMGKYSLSKNSVSL